MRKFYLVISLLLSLCMLFSACSAEERSVSAENTVGTVSENEDYVNPKNNGEVTENISSSASQKESSTEPSSLKTEESTTQAAAKSKNKKSKSSAKIKEESSGKEKTEAKYTTSKNKSVSANENTSDSTEKNSYSAVTQTTALTKTEKVTVTQVSTSKAETTKKETSQTTASSASEITCSVKIECSVILDNMDKLKAGHSSYVLSDGIILDTYAVTMPSGSTAYDALEEACLDNDIKINAQKTSYGVYVSGINNIDEKDCGKNSGWIYSVNDTFPQRSCGLYKLSKGDKVVFSYTC